MYEYFISYAYNNGRMSGQGCASVMRDKPITTYVDLQEVIETIRKDNKFDSVVIINWERFGEPPPPKTREELVEALRNQIRGLDITVPEAALLKNLIDECTIVFGGPKNPDNVAQV